MMKKRTTAGMAATLLAAFFVLVSCQDLKDFDIQAGTLVKYTGAATKVKIPSNVTAIGAKAFSGLTGLTSVTIPSSVTSIGAGAFHDCTGLTSVTIGEDVSLVGQVGPGPTVSISFDGDLVDVYNRNGKEAGTYVVYGGDEYNKEWNIKNGLYPIRATKK